MDTREKKPLMTMVMVPEDFRRDMSAKVIFDHTLVPDPRAHFAMELARHFSLVAGEIDGEDTAGRQKLRLMSAPEVAQRSCEVAQECFVEFESRGWLAVTPSLEERFAFSEASEEKQDERDEARSKARQKMREKVLSKTGE